MGEHHSNKERAGFWLRGPEFGSSSGIEHPVRLFRRPSNHFRLAVPVTRLEPGALLRAVRARAERLLFARVPRVTCDADKLTRTVKAAELNDVFQSKEIGEEWHAREGAIAAMAIPEKADSVNPGDRRAIFFLIRHFKPRRVLEVGTHLGASTVHIAAALQDADGETSQVKTVDLVDVNSETATPWLEYGAPYSPAEMARRLGLEDRISFVTSRSLEYLSSCEEEYDFIFLDGDHAPRAVYEEIPAALRLLRSGGMILLHDYFPSGRPLWSSGNVIQGPWLAVERLRSEGARIEAIPLGELPWPTKLGSRATSLALLVGESKEIDRG